jgi:hypothetical protein
MPLRAHYKRPARPKAIRSTARRGGGCFDHAIGPKRQISHPRPPRACRKRFASAQSAAIRPSVHRIADSYSPNTNIQSLTPLPRMTGSPWPYRGDLRRPCRCHTTIWPLCSWRYRSFAQWPELSCPRQGLILLRLARLGSVYSYWPLCLSGQGLSRRFYISSSFSMCSTTSPGGRLLAVPPVSVASSLVWPTSVAVTSIPLG